jgi:AcrR family transcriptional regulator
VTARVKERVLRAARALEAKRGPTFTIADVARAAKVTWPTAARHLGGPEGLDALLKRSRPPPPDTRGRLLEAAARCFVRDGYVATTLDGVATEAGLTKGAVYWHFDSKRSLLLALLRDHLPGRSIEPWLWIELFALARDPEIRAALDALPEDAVSRVLRSAIAQVG